MNKKHIVQLEAQERKTLLAVISTGKNKAVVIRRAHILLKSDEGKTDAEIAELLYTSTDTVERTRRRYSEEGLQAALAGQPHPQRGPLLNESQEAHLTALACSPPPPGQSRWTSALLAEQLVRDEVIAQISAETVRLILKKK